MRIIHWNIKHNSDKEKISKALADHLQMGETIICLQEVTPEAKEEIIMFLSRYGIARNDNYAYSLSYRHPSRYDGLNRRLGVLILCSHPMYITDCNVLSRTPFPDRTMWADIQHEGNTIRVISLHSITGCGYSKAKSAQYFSFAEAVDNLKPDIVTIDANEPKQDHYEVEKMEFYDNHDKGNGAKTFFRTMATNGMSDAYVQHYNPEEYTPGRYLTTSIRVNRKGECRYDFIFISNRKMRNRNCQYLFREGTEATSDHAIVITDVEMIQSRRSSDHNLLTREHLIKYCRYYGHTVDDSTNLFADYERHWVEDVLNNNSDPHNFVQKEDLHFLETFYPEDGVPIGIKAILFNRYFHWDGYGTIDGFKKWYLERYLGGSLKGKE